LVRDRDTFDEASAKSREASRRKRSGSEANGVSREERHVLGKLTGLVFDAQAGTTAEPEPPPREDLERNVDTSGTGKLTEAEQTLRRELLQESRRVVQEVLPGMFGKTSARVGVEEHAVVRESYREVVEVEGLARIGSLALDVLEAPARRLGFRTVTWLGLTGLVLLMVLMVAILLRVFWRV